MAKSWSAQKWSKVRFEGRLCVLVERNKDAQLWLAVDVDANSVVEIKGDTDVEVLPVVPEEDRSVLKKSYKPIVRAYQQNRVVPELG